MRAYYFDNVDGDQRAPHEGTPPRPVSQEHLRRLGVECFRLLVDDEDSEHKLNKIAAERGYKNRDTMELSRSSLGEAYDATLKMIFAEHLHEDNEIRYVLQGGGYFDIRDIPSNEWIRIAVGPGDLLVLPAGIYHRFTVDANDHIRGIRLFKNAPKWFAHSRSPDADALPVRQEYLHPSGVGAQRLTGRINVKL